MCEDDKRMGRPKRHWLALFWLGVLLTGASGYLLIAGFWPLLDSADDPVRGATGQWLVLTGLTFLVVGPVFTIAANRFG